MSYSAKVYRKEGGDSLVLDPGGKIVFGDITFTIDADGNVIVTGIPTAEPAAVGALYSNAGVLTLSNGP